MGGLSTLTDCNDEACRAGIAIVEDEKELVIMYKMLFQKWA
jgi:hypothetical protein